MGSNNIQGPRGLRVPTFQPANNKGNDGQGNGSGGMFFGQDDQQNQQPQPWHNPFADAGMEDVPYFVPLFGNLEPILNNWKAAAAKLIYNKKEE